MVYGTQMPLDVAINFHETYEINLEFSRFQVTFQTYFLIPILKKLCLTSKKVKRQK